MINILSPNNLRKSCLQDIELSNSNILSLPNELIDQQRAEEALALGLKIKSDGFNVFASGDEGTGKMSAVKMFLEKWVDKDPTPDDWCYVYNFKEPYQPTKLKLPAGVGNQLKTDMKDFVSDTMQSLVKTFESESYGLQRQSIKDKYDKQQSTLTLSINEKAENESLLIKQTPMEVYTLPLKKGEIMTDDEFDTLPLSEKKLIQEKQTRFTNEMDTALKQQRILEKEMVKEFKKLEKEVATLSITEITEDICNKYKEIPDVINYITNVKNDMLENLTDFMIAQKEKFEELAPRENEFSRTSINGTFHCPFLKYFSFKIRTAFQGNF
jgi:hypothetical protein